MNLFVGSERKPPELKSVGSRFQKRLKRKWFRIKKFDILAKSSKVLEPISNKNHPVGIRYNF